MIADRGAECPPDLQRCQTGTSLVSPGATVTCARMAVPLRGRQRCVIGRLACCPARLAGTGDAHERCIQLVVNKGFETHNRHPDHLMTSKLASHHSLIAALVPV